MSCEKNIIISILTAQIVSPSAIRGKVSLKSLFFAAALKLLFCGLSPIYKAGGVCSYGFVTGLCTVLRRRIINTSSQESHWLWRVPLWGARTASCCTQRLTNAMILVNKIDIATVGTNTPYPGSCAVSGRTGGFRTFFNVSGNDAVGCLVHAASVITLMDGCGALVE